MDSCARVIADAATSAQEVRTSVAKKRGFGKKPARARRESDSERARPALLDDPSSGIDEPERLQNTDCTANDGNSKIDI
jgi:hypothetical protein